MHHAVLILIGLSEKEVKANVAIHCIYCVCIFIVVFWYFLQRS